MLIKSLSMFTLTYRFLTETLRADLFLILVFIYIIYI